MSDELPKLRPLNSRWAPWQGEDALVLEDPFRLSQGSAVVPRAMVPLLALLDGTRDLNAVRVGFMLRTGVYLLSGQLDSFIGSLDGAFLLDNGRFRERLQQALETYRSGPCRTPVLAGAGYPDEGTALGNALSEYCRRAGVDSEKPPGRVVGVISPHIDYSRGWRAYAETWQRVRAAAEDADLVILLGTDHAGSPGSLTLTRQSYSTPWGILPTDSATVEQLAGILGGERAFVEEVHHVGEHSIELAAVWLHYMAGGKPKTLVPILCGSHEGLLKPDNGDAGPVWDVMAYLAELAARRRVLVVAAGDLSHVGPAFGDPSPMDLAFKARVRSWDDQWLAAACSGSSDLLTDLILERGDPTRICGAAPIHYMVAILRQAKGQVVTYEQCPADEQGSFVSVAGALFTA